MFLPTKAHTSEILKTDKDRELEEQGLGYLLPQGTQHKIRMGTRVPKDAVNLAYAHIPPINSRENVLITDLSNTILENSKNAQASDVYMYPDKSLLLNTIDGKSELPTMDVSMTNIFKDGVPLYYAHRLTYLHFDNAGPDEFGMYDGNGITIVDRKGSPIIRPYRIQLIATEMSRLYEVIVYTSFNDTESDTYSVIYNAVSFTEDGRTITESGFTEKLNLHPAFSKVDSLRAMMPMIKDTSSYPIYYQGNGVNPAYSKFFVPTPPIKDARQPEFFRFQVGVEITINNEKRIFTTPWNMNGVLNVTSLTPDERQEYQNGSRLVTTETSETIMRRYVEDSYMFHIRAKKRYFVICNNDRVKMSTRIDGSSPVYARTDANTDPASGPFKVPMKVAKIKEPKMEEGILFYKVRPIRGADRTSAYISFVIDGSKSMKRFDADGGYRVNLIESIAAAGRDFYENSMINGYYYQYGYKTIREEFSDDIDQFVKEFQKIRKDDDTTKPSLALSAAANSLEGIRLTQMRKAKKTIVMLTDGEFLNYRQIEDQIVSAKARDISLCIVTFNHFDELNRICKNHGMICINAMSPQASMDLRHFFFELSGMEESEYLFNEFGHVVTKQFLMSPLDNDLQVLNIDMNDQQGIGRYIPQYAKDRPERYGLQILLKDATGLPFVTKVEELPIDDPLRLAIYIKDYPSKHNLPSFNGADVISIKAMQSADTYFVYAKCESWQYSFKHTYAVRFNDTQQIRVLGPREEESHLSWYPRIKNGRFERTLLDTSGRPTVYSYSIPEYYSQSFSTEHGMPYMRVQNERPKVLNDSQIKVLYSPLYVQTEKGKVKNVSVLVNDRPIAIRSWHTFDGIFDLDGIVTENDDIVISYEYVEDGYIYRGYYDEDSQRFWSLDLNPSAGHYVTIRDRHDGEVKDLPSFALINETVYLYLRPAAKYTPVNFKAVYSIEDKFTSEGYRLPEPALRSHEFVVGRVDLSGDEIELPMTSAGTMESYTPTVVDNVITHIRILNPQPGTYFIRYGYMSNELRAIDTVKTTSLFHTFDKIDDAEAILIGEIHVRPNSNHSSIKLIDTRSRGGGLKPEITQAIMEEFEPESSFYWDIGHWDGKPYSENAVAIFRFSRRILKEYGGRFSKAEVEEKLDKHLGYGNLAIIEYIEDSDELLSIPENLVVEVIAREDDGDIVVEVPTYQLVLEG
ncbi:vWA domain-containing protein (plasmid) [Paenibacillus sp. EC2-1]|uniref:vWA domain-containing protein n=1 Tax=Paenibacillus sp. EC2-1 TaxID=3388665 RepID=UPI003BEF406C